ncbi:hypothetical protein PENSPDRAFT_215839 [Peniophora sp. CONT]|nr:hypothetical protein PENSPDRAFT_215839 [Peniophora sp. CONT]
MARRSFCALTTEWPTTESPELNKALSVILGLPENEIADALVKCRDKGCLTLLGDDVKIAQQYNKAEPTIPVADWEDIAGQHGVPLSFMALNGDLKHHSLTPCYPPPSFHYALFQSAWHALDTFDDLGQQIGEGARVRTLEPYILAVASIFRARIIVLPDQPMKTKVLSSGGELKYEIYASGGSFFIVRETEQLMMQKSAYVSQLFLELLDIAKINSWNNLGRRRRVHGLLTDLYSYRFYSYDPVKESFAFDCTIKVPGNRGERLGRMLPGKLHPFPC